MIFRDLTDQDVQVILAGVAELPLKVAAPTFNKLQAQLQAEPQPLPEPTKD